MLFYLLFNYFIILFLLTIYMTYVRNKSIQTVSQKASATFFDHKNWTSMHASCKIACVKVTSRALSSRVTPHWWRASRARARARGVCNIAFISFSAVTAPSAYLLWWSPAPTPLLPLCRVLHYDLYIANWSTNELMSRENRRPENLRARDCLAIFWCFLILRGLELKSFVWIFNASPKNDSLCVFGWKHLAV